MTWVEEKIKEEAKKDSNFMTWFEEENNKLEIAVALTQESEAIV